MGKHSTIGEGERRKWNRGVLYRNRVLYHNSLEPIQDPDIEITSESEEETFEPAEDNHMEVALMMTSTKFKAGLPEDFSGKNEDAML